MTRQDYAETGFSERLVELDGLSARVCKNGFDTELFQSFDYDFCAFDRLLGFFCCVFHNSAVDPNLIIFAR